MSRQHLTASVSDKEIIRSASEWYFNYWLRLISVQIGLCNYNCEHRLPQSAACSLTPTRFFSVFKVHLFQFISHLKVFDKFVCFFKCHAALLYNSPFTPATFCFGNWKYSICTVIVSLGCRFSAITWSFKCHVNEKPGSPQRISNRVLKCSHMKDKKLVKRFRVVRGVCTNTSA